MINAQRNVKLVKLQTIIANYVMWDIFCTKVLQFALKLAQKNSLEILRQTLVFKSARMEKPMI